MPPVVDVGACSSAITYSTKDNRMHHARYFWALVSLALAMVVRSPVSMMIPVVYPAAGCGDYHGRWPHDHGWRDEHGWRGRQDRDGDRDPDAHGHTAPRLHGKWHGKTRDTQDGHDPKRP